MTHHVNQPLQWHPNALPLMLIMPSIFCAALGLEARCEGPRVFLLNGESLLAARQRISEGDKQLQPAYEALRRDADRALGTGPFSVVNKSAVPPGGDKHDYMSFAPYWWPNPETKNGLPYIQRDGERNPDIYQLRNRADLGSMADALETLGLAYYFTGDEKYATRARLLVHTWFIEPETRMNPNFEFAQAIRGVNTGRGLGLIESRLFTKAVDAVGLLAGSPSWTNEDEREIDEWFSTFLNWMLSSEHDHDEANAKNNHGTYYDVQVASFALFLGKEELARQVVQEAKTRRIAVQIEPDGRQPLELTRTKAWSYSVGNLSGLMSLARLGEHVDVDLWNFKTPDDRSIRAALDFLIPFSEGRKKWPYEQIGGFSGQAVRSLVQQAAAHYREEPYAALLRNNGSIGAESRSNLIYSDSGN
jgi:hypothetical protein